MKKISLLWCAILLGCGQQGRLYLSDQDRLAHSHDPAVQARIQARMDKEREILAQIETLQIKRRQMKQKNQASEAIDLEILEAQYQLGQLTLQKQLTGQNQ